MYKRYLAAFNTSMLMIMSMIMLHINQGQLRKLQHLYGQKNAEVIHAKLKSDPQCYQLVSIKAMETSNLANKVDKKLMYENESDVAITRYNRILRQAATVLDVSVLVLFTFCDSVLCNKTYFLSQLRNENVIKYRFTSS